MVERLLQRINKQIIQLFNILKYFKTDELLKNNTHPRCTATLLHVTAALLPKGVNYLSIIQRPVVSYSLFILYRILYYIYHYLV